MFHLAHSRVMLDTKNDHLHISFSLEIDRCLDVLIQMEDEEYESVKRPHVTTGNTPHKPDDKRCRTVPERSNRKRLSFPRSPANLVNTTRFNFDHSRGSLVAEIFQLLCVDKQTKSPRS